MILIADVFLNIQNPKNVVGEISKKFRFEGTFGK